jgi:hypothetical protein
MTVAGRRRRSASWVVTRYKKKMAVYTNGIESATMVSRQGTSISPIPMCLRMNSSNSETPWNTHDKNDATVMKNMGNGIVMPVSQASKSGNPTMKFHFGKVRKNVGQGKILNHVKSGKEYPLRKISVKVRSAVLTITKSYTKRSVSAKLFRGASKHNSTNLTKYIEVSDRSSFCMGMKNMIV